MGDFHFLRPGWFALLPVGLWLIWRYFRGRTDVGGWSGVVDTSLRAHVLVAPELLRDSRWPVVAALAAWTLAIVGLAGPAWQRLPVPAFRSDEALVVALDLSRSMDAGDVEPSRLARAKLKLLDLLDKRTAGQTALVVFSTNAFTVTPLTTDTRTIASLVNSVSTDIMPTQGSSVDAGLQRALELMKQTGLSSGDVLVISDADITADDLDRASELRGKGFNVSVLAVGTEQGAPIGLSEGGFLRDNNDHVVIPQLDVAGLRRLAAAGGGRFARLTPDDRDLESLFPPPAAVPGNVQLKKEDSQQHQADVWRDNGLWFAVALLPLVALGFRRGWICLWLACFLIPTPQAHALDWQSLWLRSDQRGYEALQSQEAERAAQLFKDPGWRAAAQYRAGDFGASAATLGGLDTAQSQYNRGNALAKAGKLEEAIKSYDRALELDSGLEDARYNRDLVKDYLKKNPPQQQQQQKQGQNGQQDQQKQQGQSQKSDGGDQSDQQSADERNDSSKGDQSAERRFEVWAESKRRRATTSPKPAPRRRARRQASRQSKTAKRRAAGRPGFGLGTKRRREMGVGASSRAVAATCAAGSGRAAAAQVSLSISAARCRPRRQDRHAHGGASVVNRAVVRALACLSLLVAPLALAQQDSVLKATVDRPVVHDNESFTYTLRAEGPVRGDPEMDSIERQFDVLGQNKSSRIQFVNGQTSQVTEWQFQLMPKSEGNFDLPAVSVGTLQSNAVNVRVIAPERGDGSTADVFMELEATPETVYVQSQVILKLRLFVAVSTGRATLTQPEVTGGEAIVERLGEDAQYQTMRGGRTYIVRERRFAVFPQQAGPLTIGPAVFEAMVIPDRGFSRVQRFRSSTVNLDVQPAVAPPASMAGAAWLPAERVTLSEQWTDDGDKLPVGVPRTRKIIIEADGLLETQLPEIAIPEQDGIRQYTDQPELSRDVTDHGLRARRSVSVAIIAQNPGNVTLEGLKLPWWNVTAKRWEVAELPPHTLEVTPSAETPPPAAAPEAPAPVASPETVAPTTTNVWLIVSSMLALVWLVTVGLWWRSRSPSPGARGVSKAAAVAGDDPGRRRLLRELRAACVASDADTARRLLLKWAEQRFPESPPRSLGSMAVLVPDEVAREVLDLEVHIYGATAGRWDGHSLGAVLPVLESAGKTPRTGKEEPLLPLYR